MRDTGFVGKLLKFIIVSVSALVTGSIGLTGLFSDLGPNETMAGRVAIVAIVYLFGCGIIGALLLQKWYLSVIAAWGPILLSIFMLVNMGTAADIKFFVLFWLSALIGFPLFTLVCGYVGAWLCRKLQGHHKTQKNIQEM